MITIGMSLDLAPTHTGLVVWHDETPIYHTRYTAKTPLEMALKTIEYIKEDDPDWVAIEDCYYGKNIKNFGMTKWLIGYLVGYCLVMGPKVFVGLTATIDSACDIPHTDRKTHTRTLAELMFPDENLSEDECDAVAIGLWGYGVSKTTEWTNLDKTGKV